MMRNLDHIQVLGFGQCSLDYLGQLGTYPPLDQKVELSSFLVQGGGPVATALVTLARLGVPVAMAGAVGGDEAGEKIREGLEAEKVDCCLLQTDADGCSQVAFIVVDGAGHRNIFWHRGDAQLPMEIDLSRYPGCRVLHLDGLHVEPAIQLARQARQRGIITVLDGGSLREQTEGLLPFVDHLVVSEKFARQLSTGGPEDALRLLPQWDAKAVTITLGKQGSLSLLKDGTAFHQPAFTVDVVDTTGCGDVFHGGYIFGLLQGWETRRMVQFAAACAALKCRALGGREAIPGLDEVNAFISSNTLG